MLFRSITTPGLTNTGTETLVNLTTTGNTILGDASTDTLNVGNGGLIKDASGNVGIGVTPSAWGSASRAMQFQSGVSIFSNTTGLGGVGNNVYSNPGTGDYYIANGYATRYYQYNGTHVWNTAANNVSGAGAALTFTQAMTLDASGRLGVGETSPTGRIQSVGSSSIIPLIISNTSTSGYSGIQFSNTEIGRAHV